MRTARWTSALAAATLTLAAVGGCAGVSVATGGSPTTTSTGSTQDSRAAAAQLGKLTVATAGSMKGYSRAKFPHWRSTGANCDVRDSVLKRDGTKVKTSGCNVVAGTW